MTGEPVRPDAPAPEPAAAGAALLTADSHRQMEQFRRSRETQVLTILLCDLEGSTRQQSRLGNVRAAGLVRDFRGIFRTTMAGLDGQEVETAGDSVLAVFAAPSEGVKFALRLEAAVRSGREQEPELPAARVGIHQGQVVVDLHAEGPKAMDIYGLQVSVAARITDLAAGGQVLCSRSVFDDARAILRGEDFGGLGPVAWRNHGPYRFKGVEDSYEVCEVGIEGTAPLAAPPAGAKSWPADRSDEELGWRPAAGVTVPGTSWQLVERLGKDDSGPEGRRRFKGGFGEVWKAWNPADKSAQAFKFCFRRDQVHVLKREARLLKRLRRHHHPNLVEVYDVTEQDRPPYYLEMEYVEGPSLEEWLSGNPPLAERLEAVAQVADALDTVHAAGICHRDIKPSNILLTRRGDGALQAKLADFGLGAAEDEDLLRSLYTSRVEGVAGTWDYIAPELRKGGKASPQSDLYSLGLTLFQLAAGDLKAQAGPGWESRVPDEVLRADIARCMQAEPAARWERAGALATALRSHGERRERLCLERERELRRRRSRRLRAAGAVVGLLLGVALAALVWWWRLPGTLEIDVQPPGATVEVAGRTLGPGGWPAALKLPAGRYEIRAAAHGHFEDVRGVELRNDQRLAQRFDLEPGVRWTHTAPSVQGAAWPVADLDGDGVPEIAHNGLDAVGLLSGASGRPLAGLSAPASGSRTFELLDLGGEVGPVLAAAKEAPGAPGRLEVFAIRTAAPGRFLWRWSGPGSDWRQPHGAGLRAAGDLNGDGVEELAVSSRDGRVYLLDGRTGAKLREVVLLDRALAQPPGFEVSGRGPDAQLVYLARPGDPGAEWSGRPLPLLAGAVRLADGGRLWEADLGQPDGTMLRDLDGDGAPELVTWKGAGWQVLDGASGKSRGGGTAPGGRRMPPGPALADLDGDGRLEFLLCFPEASARLAAVRPEDGKLLWEGPADARAAQPTGRDGLLLRAGGGGILVALNGALAALDPRTGGTVWRAEQAPDGVLVGDWDGDGRPEVFVTTEGQGLVCLDGAGRRRWALRLEWDVRPYLLLPDIDGDGLAEILVHRHAALWGLVRGPRALGFRAELWAQNATGPLQSAPLVVPAAGGAPQLVIQSGPWARGRSLRCLDAATGRERWGSDWQFTFNRALALADWDGDGRLEVVGIGFPPGSAEARLAAFRAADGQLIASFPVENHGSVYSTPVVADLNGDGAPDLAIHRWDRQDVIAIDGRTGKPMWRHPTGSFNMGGVGAGDLDGDGLPDVVAPSMDGFVHALRGRDGRPVWPPCAIGEGGSRSPPLVADVTGDGVPDVLVVARDGALHVIDGRRGETAWRAGPAGASEGLGRPALARTGGRTLVLAPLGTAGLVAFDAATHAEVWRSPPRGAVLAGAAVADLDGDGLQEVVVATAGGRVLVLDLADGALLWSTEVSGKFVEAEPALADLDGDGVLDILVADHAFRLTALNGLGVARARKRQAAPLPK